MSDHGHAAHAEPAGGHDHHYEGVPADRPGPDEPRTPGWLPLLGIGLVLCGILAFVLIQPDGRTREQLNAEIPQPTDTGVQAEAAPSPVPPAAERRPARPAGSGVNVRPLGSAFPRVLGSGSPRRPGQFAVPGGSAAPIPQRKPSDPHFGHNHP